jgi:muramoyltetrapeptide carboxypeptidase
MQRRKFIQNIGIGGLILPLNPIGIKDWEDSKAFSDSLIPEALKKGDTIGIVSPSSAIFESEPYEIAKESFEAMGLQVKFGKNIKNRHGHLAGTDEERAEELNDMFRDKTVRAVIALRGGSGAARILDKIDYKLIKDNPKIFIGYSDITALHLAIFSKTGMITYHGPVAISSWNSYSTDYLQRLLFQKEAITYTNPTKKPDELVQTRNRIRVINEGTAKGELLGGNLSVLTGIMGSEYFPKDWTGKILYIEDVGEKIYAVDRMMSQLQLGGVLDQISGFVFGKCTECDPGGNGYGSLTLEEVIDHYIKPLNIPAYSGAMIGHINDNITIPNGIAAELDAAKGSIKLLRPAVS